MLNKTFLFVVVLIVFLVALSLPVLAQEPTSPVATPTPIINPDNPQPPPEVPAQLPDTAIEAFNLAVAMLAGLFAAMAGFVGFTLTKLLKEHVPWLSKENRDKLGAGVTRLLIVIFNALVGAGVAWLMPYVAGLDSTGLWGALLTLISVVGLPVLVGGSPVFAELWHRLSKIGKAA